MYKRQAYDLLGIAFQRDEASFAASRAGIGISGPVFGIQRIDVYKRQDMQFPDEPAIISGVGKAFCDQRAVLRQVARPIDIGVRLSENAQKSVLRFSKEEFGRRMEKLYQFVLMKKSTAEK